MNKVSLKKIWMKSGQNLDMYNQGKIWIKSGYNQGKIWIKSVQNPD